MRVYNPTKQVTKPTMSIICDLCGKIPENDDWNCNQWRINGVPVGTTVKQNDDQKINYADGSNIDICPNCFKNKVIPWIISQYDSHSLGNNTER